MVEFGEGKADIRAQLAELVPGWQQGDETLLGPLLAGARIVRMDRDNFVFRAGEQCEAFMIVISGSVRVQLMSPSGREVTLYRIGPGGSCILTTSCLLSREHYPAEAITESDTRALAISTTAFQAAMENSTRFRKFVFDGFSSRLTSVIQKIEEIAFTSIDVRLAAFLLELDDRRTESVTHQDIAVELGTAREVISRHLKRFESRGWVELGRSQISVIDRPSIEGVARTVGD